MKKLVIMGSVNADHVLQVATFPRPGETLHGRNYQVIAGGKGANQAVAVARLKSGNEINSDNKNSTEVSFIACVGDDAFGITTRERYQQEGMSVDAITIEPHCPTGIAMIQVSDEGENSIVLSAEANDRLTAEKVSSFADKIKVADYLLVQLETPLDGIEKAISLAKEASAATAKSIQIILNPAPARQLTDSLLANIDIITPNETEAEVLTGITIIDDESAQAAANCLHKKGIKTVMITLGAKGVWLSQQQNDTFIDGELVSGFQVDAIDTTAAGDTFNGALMVALSEQMPLKTAIRFAHAAAAISVTRFGAQTSIPTRQEVELFLAKRH